MQFTSCPHAGATRAGEFAQVYDKSKSIPKESPRFDEAREIGFAWIGFGCSLPPINMELDVRGVLVRGFYRNLRSGFPKSLNTHLPRGPRTWPRKWASPLQAFQPACARRGWSLHPPPLRRPGKLSCVMQNWGTAKGERPMFPFLLGSMSSGRLGTSGDLRLGSVEAATGIDKCPVGEINWECRRS